MAYLSGYTTYRTVARSWRAALANVSPEKYSGFAFLGDIASKLAVEQECRALDRGPSQKLHGAMISPRIHAKPNGCVRGVCSLTSMSTCRSSEERGSWLSFSH